MLHTFPGFHFNPDEFTCLIINFTLPFNNLFTFFISFLLLNRKKVIKNKNSMAPDRAVFIPAKFVKLTFSILEGNSAIKLNNHYFIFLFLQAKYIKTIAKKIKIILLKK